MDWCAMDLVPFRNVFVGQERQHKFIFRNFGMRIRQEQ